MKQNENFAAGLAQWWLVAFVRTAHQETIRSSESECLPFEDLSGVLRFGLQLFPQI